MSSNPLSNLRRPRSQRAKLTAQLVAVTAAVCVILTLTTEFALHSFLIGQLDGQLEDASRRAVDFARHGPRNGPPPEGQEQGPINAQGQGSGTLNARIVNGTVLDAQRLNTSGTPEALPTDLYAVLTGLPPDRTITRDLGDLGSYRLTAARMPDDDIVITGLPLSSVDDTLLIVGFILGGV